MRTRHALVTTLAFAAFVVSLSATSAHAYSTRVHIVIANQLREALIESGDGSITLAWSGARVVLPEEDAAAIVEHPLEFRAGAIGPDNFVFPGMTDATHALGQNPFEMCELLYVDAVTGAERAYALGCFLHGTTDAIAHHFVNLFTGETFTLHPISSARASSFSNVAGHIVTETAIQGAFFRASPESFAAGPLALDIPNGFVSRNFHQAESRVWRHMMEGTVERLDRTRASMPDATLFEVVSATELGPWEQVGLAPVFIEELQRLRGELRTYVLDDIADMQNPASERGMTLMVGEGPDGVLSTADDTTACSLSCPSAYARYHVFTNLLLPRMDAGGRELPSAFDAISGDLERELNLFLPALLQTIENLAVILNGPLASEDDLGFELSVATLETAIAPMRAWLDRVLAIDFDAIARAITPAWYTRLENLFSSVGIDIRIGSLLAVIFQPAIDMIRMLIEEQVIDVARGYLETLSAELSATRGTWDARIDEVLTSTRPVGASGHVLDDVPRSGLFAYSFNLAAATFANHELVLSADALSGPATFDASYAHNWTQAGLCDYLREAIFPEGTSVGAILSLRVDDALQPAQRDEDSPVECHEGSLSEFGTPSAEACAVTSLDALMTSRRGSLSRSYPPRWAAIMPRCLNVAVPGLPDPPVVPDEDAGVGTDAGPTGRSDGGTDAEPTGGCSCEAAGDSRGSWLSLLLVALALLVRRPRRASSPRRVTGRGGKAIGLATLLLAACGGDDDGPDAATDDAGNFDAGMDDAEVVLDGDTDAGDDSDAGPDLRRELLAALGSSTWSSVLPRAEGERVLERAYEMRFRASALEWAEIRNPFGPARLRTLRSFSVRPDGRTIESIILSPGGWPPHPRNGLRQVWDVEIIEGSPRVLRLTEEGSGLTEELMEGAWPEPTEGLTAELRVFGPTGAAWEAFCGAGFTLDDSERRALWAFARDGTGAPVLGEDVVAGVPLLAWDDSADGANDFSVTDVHGFDRLGGTLLTQQFNFVVRYTGTIEHPGGTFSMREDDDRLEDALWAFIGEEVGSANVSDLFLEVHNWANPDATPDVVTRTIEASPVPIEIIVVRCAMPFDGKTMRAELNLAGGGWRLVGEQPSTPVVNATLFPPAL